MENSLLDSLVIPPLDVLLISPNVLFRLKPPLVQLSFIMRQWLIVNFVFHTLGSWCWDYEFYRQDGLHSISKVHKESSIECFSMIWYAYNIRGSSTTHLCPTSDRCFLRIPKIVLFVTSAYPFLYRWCQKPNKELWVFGIELLTIIRYDSVWDAEETNTIFPYELTHSMCKYNGKTLHLNLFYEIIYGDSRNLLLLGSVSKGQLYPDPTGWKAKQKMMGISWKWASE